MVAVTSGKRIACPDGSCTGIIKENGQCGTCGLHHAWEPEKTIWEEKTPEKKPPSQIKCPKCSSTQITAQKKGFGLFKAAAGALMIGPYGLLGGVAGAGKVKVTCIACGHSWTAGSSGGV
jgi:tellurium resistance protein TerD